MQVIKIRTEGIGFIHITKHGKDNIFWEKS